MFRSRRPVPSEDALRVLRSLAYVSSGTVCGAAALVAEERRRQTCLAKKIVDNSKRLKQHPRYAHSAAAAAAAAAAATAAADPIVANAQSNYEDDPFLLHSTYLASGKNEAQGRLDQQVERADGRWSNGVNEAAESGQEMVHGKEHHHHHHHHHQDTTRHRRHRHRHVRPEPDAFRSEVLPSEVEKNYKKLSRRRNANHDPASTPTSRSGNEGHEHAFIWSRSRRNEGGSSKSDTTPGIGAVLATPVEPLRHVVSEAFQRLCALCKHKPGGQLPAKMPAVPPEVRIQHDQPLGRESAQLQRHHQRLDALSSPEHISSLIATFLQLAHEEYEHYPVQYSLLATHLLKLSTEAGAAEAIELLTSWLLEHGLFDIEHLRSICLDAHVALSAELVNGSPRHHLSFYKTLLLSETVSVFDEHDVAQCKLFALSAMLVALPNQQPTTATMTALFESFSGCVSSTRHAFQRLQHSCLGLLRRGRYDAASSLFEYCANRLVGHTEELNKLADRLYTAALEADQLNECATLLKWKHETNLDITTVLYTLITKCVVEADHALLVRLYTSYHSRIPFPREHYPALCAALCAEARLDDAAAIAIRHIRRPYDSQMLAAYQPAWPALLRRHWTTTQNYDASKALFSTLQAEAGSGPSIIQRDLYNAMIQISIEHKSPESARELLLDMQDLHGLPPNLDTLGHFVISSALDQKWHAVEDLLKALQGEPEDIAPANERTRIFNRVLREHVKHNSPSASWSFVANAIEEYDLKPNKTTTNIIMDAFIDGKCLELIPQWLAFLETSGIYMDVDADLAHRLMRHYYYDFRPAFVNMSWLCYTVTRDAPELKSERLTCLVRDAIGHDLRNIGGGKNAVKLQSMAKLRLDQLDAEGVTAAQTMSTEPAEPLPAPKTEVSADVQDDALVKPAARPSFRLEAIAPSRLDPAEDKYLTEAQLLLQLSLGRPADAVALFKRSLSASGLPHSAYSLEMAVQAALRSANGKTLESEHMLESAQAAGLNVASALAPLLMQRMRASGDSSLAEFRNTVRNFYREMDANNVPLKQHVATEAAHLLISRGRPSDGISLLREIFHSGKAASRPLDLGALTVFLQGYVKLAHEPGINWVVQTVLDRSLRLDPAFMAVLRRSQEHFRLAARASGQLRHQALYEILTRWRDACKTRRAEQTREANAFGTQLVRHIVAAARRQKPLAITQRERIESSIFGEKWDTAAPTYGARDALAAKYGAVRKSKAAESNDGETSERAKVKMRKLFLGGKERARYKEFLRRGIRDEEGRRCKFRYVEHRGVADVASSGLGSGRGEGEGVRA